MSAIEAIVLGIVQGLTEFLPISSTGHLRIVPAFFGWEDPGASFTAVTQLGTMAAVVLYFRKDLWQIATAFLAGLRDPARRSNHDYKMGWYIVLGTVPIAIFGFAFQDQIKSGARDLYITGTALIVFGLLMLAADRLALQKREVEDVDRNDAVAVGFAQALALVPGVSRSGATISAGLLMGLTRTAAARYSFLLSVPAVVLSGVFELRDIGEGGGAGWAPTALATLLAFVAGYASIAFLLKFLVNHGLGIFVAYRLVLGTVVLALVSTGAIS